MTMRKKIMLFVIILLLALSLTACARGRFRDRWTSTDNLSVPPEGQSEELSQGLDTSSPEGEPSQMDDISGDIAEVDALLDELDDILRNTNTNVDIP